LSSQEAADVTAFLHNQRSLNLTANANATAWEAWCTYQTLFTNNCCRWDNVIVLVEVLPPNKTAALPYLNGEGPAPPRYAKSTIQFQATTEPYIQEYQIGPLPISNETTVEELNWPFNKGIGRTRVYNAGSTDSLYFLGNVSQSIVDITIDLWNGVSSEHKVEFAWQPLTDHQTYLNLPNDTLTLSSSDPLEIGDDGSVTAWNQFFRVPNNIFGTGSLLQLGLHFRTNTAGRDPSKWAVTGWFYGGIFYETTDDFRNAYYAPGFKKLGYDVEGDLYWTDPTGSKPPLDPVAPPKQIAPAGARYSVDESQKYVEWSKWSIAHAGIQLYWLATVDWSFYIAFRRDTGLRLYDIKFRGERIIYELGMEEAAAHYAGFGPQESYVSFMDSYYGFGPSTFELVDGFDCPSYATYLSSSTYWREATTSHANSMCLFEFDGGYPTSRHSSNNYVTVQKNIFLTLRSISTLGNYDYMFDYNFYRDGSIEVSVRASGYIDAAFGFNNTEYGFQINDHLSGSMHDHVLNYRLDLDINGTANSLQKVEFIPAQEM
jgi:primary-amine oxidase